ncbi:uncharacterized protein LOC111697733 [Eurytemora carolleeae]|uniref:uncharacterized protein LOC111697733 n=1 Tax=Eurytemora carolleeae TaxID=1294199 RepID=UPI000C756354|nr:uncharacterized protein LOC111697733 [Eurytemora carolleeae]|eukprot:XP_023323600.1 uncharacterized protein LOC111697733 [Eurytemora affinis]
MAEIMKKELDIKDFEMTSTVENTCFIDIPEDEIKMENIEVKDENSDYELDPLQSEPKRIRKSQHRYSCSQFKYFALTTRNLKIHVDSKHEGGYPCPECDFAATTAVILKTHVESIHEGV